MTPGPFRVTIRPKGDVTMKEKYETLFDKNRLIEITHEMQKEHFKPGYDNMTAGGAETWLEINYENLLAQLKSGSYKPLPLSGFSVTKKNGHFRRLTKACATDVILQKSIARYLTDVTESLLSESIHAYRPGKGVTTAVRQFCEYAAVYPFVLKVDPADYFGSIDYSVLERGLSLLPITKKLIKLLLRFVQAPVIEDGKAVKREKGLPQGIPIAPVLANWYLHPLDELLEERGFAFIRYADDIAIFGNDYETLEDLYREICTLLHDQLLLCENAEKCAIDIPERITYLGYGFTRNRNGVISLDVGLPDKAVFRKWTPSKVKSRSSQVNLVSNGILSKNEFALRFDTDNAKYDFPPFDCDSINVFSDVVFDSGFLAYAAKNRISINVFNERGKRVGVFIPQNRPLSAPVTLAQLEHYGDSKKRLYLASRFVLGSVHNLRLNIRYYHKNYPNPLFTESLNAINTLEKQIKKCTDYQDLLILEARVRNAYYHCFDAFIRKNGFIYDKRSRRPPKNEVNALLGFGYTVLYNLIATEIYKSALDIRVGFLHATNKRAESLNLDIAELFKPLVIDRVVFTVINRSMIERDVHFEHLENGTVYLNSEGKNVFLRAIQDKLESTVTVGNHTESYSEIIQNEVKKLVLYFRKENAKYTPFKQVR